MDHSVHLSEDLCDVLTDSRNGGDSSNEAHKRNSIDGNNKQTSEFDAFI
jgi:tRNA pseudouridine synthase 10